MSEWISLKVPFDDREEVKALGVKKWNPKTKKWMVLRKDWRKYRKWLTEEEIAYFEKAEKKSVQVVRDLGAFIASVDTLISKYLRADEYIVEGDVCASWMGDGFANLEITMSVDAKDRLRVFVSGDADFPSDVRVRLKGRLKMYRGQIQLRVASMEDVEVLGDETAYKRQLAAWEEEYPKDRNVSREIVFRTQRVGVISTGERDAGYSDFKNRLSRYLKSGELAFETRFCKLTAENVIQRMQELDGMGLDVVAIVRGGGNPYDLLDFYKPELMKAVLASNTPVAIGVGHKIDDLPCGRFADLSAITPTALGTALSSILYKRKNEERKAASRRGNNAQMKMDTLKTEMDTLKTELVFYKEQANELSEENARLREALEKERGKKGFFRRIFG